MAIALLSALPIVYVSKLHKNSVKMQVFTYGATYLMLDLYSQFKFPAKIFDDISEDLPFAEANDAKKEIVNLCMLNDFEINMKSMEGELRHCKPPTDYLFSTL